MASRQRILNKLTDEFNSEDNIRFIIDETFKNIQAFHKVVVMEDDYFIDVFNDISNKIYNVESKRPNVISIYDLNDIVIKHLSDYIIDNIEDFDTKKIVNPKQSKSEYSSLLKNEKKRRGFNVSESDTESGSENKREIQKKRVSKRDENDLLKDLIETKKPKNKKKEILKSVELNNEKLTTLTLDLSEIDTMLHLDNVKSIELKSVDIINSDYIINNTNNHFSYRMLLQPKPKVLYSEEQKIEIAEGNYTLNSLINAIQEHLNFGINIDEITDKIIFTNEEEFEFTEGPLLNILGVKPNINNETNRLVGFKPIILSKRRTLPLGISINNTEPIIYEMIYLNEYRTNIQLNKIQVYKTPISIDNIYLDFDTYNFREIPFFVKLEIVYFQ
jgi:hypothetical protein